jgi:hypothetical protein
MALRQASPTSPGPGSWRRRCRSVQARHPRPLAPEKASEQAAGIVAVQPYIPPPVDQEEDVRIMDFSCYLAPIKASVQPPRPIVAHPSLPAPAETEPQSDSISEKLLSGTLWHCLRVASTSWRDVNQAGNTAHCQKAHEILHNPSSQISHHRVCIFHFAYLCFT